MDYRKAFRVDPGAKVKLKKLDPAYIGKIGSEGEAKLQVEAYRKKLFHEQGLLYAEHKHSILVVLQALDAGGKDGTINHVFSALNPQGARVAAFKQPTPAELAHDFLWRVHPQAPGRGEIAIFNRSHYEDVLITRVHKLIDKATWTERYQNIRDFEALLAENGTTILKFFLHISKEEQLARFAQRLDDPARNWKISEVRLFRAGAVGRLYRSVRGRPARHKHQEGAVVCDPLEPQVVPQPRRVSDYGRHDGGPQTRLSASVGRSRGHPAQIPRGRQARKSQ